MFTNHTVVISAAASSATNCPPQSRQHYSRGHMNLWLHYNTCIQNVLLPRKTPLQELKWKYVVLTMSVVSVWVLFEHLTDSHNWRTTFLTWQITVSLMHTFLVWSVLNCDLSPSDTHRSHTVICSAVRWSVTVKRGNLWGGGGGDFFHIPELLSMVELKILMWDPKPMLLTCI
jgi:hypothetical protein